MTKKIFLFSIFVVYTCQSLFAGDTLRVMQYNLLYYDKTTDFCTPSNNDVTRKNTYLQTITSDFRPDIFTVNEMNGSVSSVDKLLNNVFNVDGTSKYKRANYTGSYLVNMLYYNTEKLELKSQTYILTSPRITDVYRLYYKSDDLINGDTIFITCIVGHLKAGSYQSDIDDRKLAAQQIMAHINNRKLSGNILLMGDFNLYTAQEPAFQSLMTPTSTGIRFFDPVNAIGNWHDNSNFAMHHTQSTRTSGDCHSGGSMDDRFDFILASEQVMEGTAGAKYVEDTYWAYGQDGKRLNGSLISPENKSLPADVIDALYQMSDHLPVTLKLYVDNTLLSTPAIDTKEQSRFRVVNPIVETIDFWSLFNSPQSIDFEIFNQQGSVLMRQSFTVYPNEKNSINASSLTSGLYIIKIKGVNFSYSTRIVKH